MMERDLIKYASLEPITVNDSISLVRHGCFSLLGNSFRRITWSMKVGIILATLIITRIASGSFDSASQWTLSLLAFAYAVALAIVYFYCYGPALNDLKYADRVYMDCPYAEFRVATHNGHVVGCVGVMPVEKLFDSANYETAAKLRHLCVHSAYRGLGIAQTLLNQILYFARQNGYEAVELVTTDLHVEAMTLYKKAGFVLHAKKLYWYGCFPVPTYEFVYNFKDKIAPYWDVD